MTTCQDTESRLTLFVDGELAAADRAAVAAHLDTCAACRGVARDLERLRRAAGALGPVAPPDHLWLEVAGQIGKPGPRGWARRAATDPRVALRQWVGLAAMLVVVTLGAYVILHTTRVDPASTPGNAAAAGSVQAVTEELTTAMRHYENAITQLEALAKNDDRAIDPVVAATLQQNIQTIDGAIAESRSALGQNPDSAPARESLFEALKNKVGVLQATVNLMNQMRKGDQAGAAEAAAAFGKKS
jgi:hypothetical protein